MAAKTSKKQEKYTCLCCGVEQPATNFYKSTYSKVWIQSNKHVLFCKGCMEKFMDQYTQRYGEETALAICLALLDLPFYRSLYRSIIKNNNVFNLGIYTRTLNGTQYKNESGMNTILSGELSKDDNQVREEIETKWTQSDKNNKRAVLSMVGYDPFDIAELTDENRKYCYNVMAGYCNVAGIDEDSHQLESAIQITMSRLQCKRVDEMIFHETSLANPDVKIMDTLGANKKNLLATINQIAKDNNLSSAYSAAGAAGQNTLSGKMKEMAANDFKAIQVNMFDVETSAAMRQIAELSNEGILSQLSLEANDYIDIVKDQRVMLTNAQQKNDALEEENRNLKNKIYDLEGKK